jgi:hypothetical protein
MLFSPNNRYLIYADGYKTKYIIKELTVPYYDDYRYRVFASDCGLSDFNNCVFSVHATHWEEVADIGAFKSNYIDLRIWVISAVTNSTITLKSNDSVSILLNIIKYN